MTSTLNQHNMSHLINLHLPRWHQGRVQPIQTSTITGSQIHLGTFIYKHIEYFRRQQIPKRKEKWDRGNTNRTHWSSATAGNADSEAGLIRGTFVDAWTSPMSPADLPSMVPAIAPIKSEEGTRKRRERSGRRAEELTGRLAVEFATGCLTTSWGWGLIVVHHETAQRWFGSSRLAKWSPAVFLMIKWSPAVMAKQLTLPPFRRSLSVFRVFRV